jgi:hypothetical protein
LRDKNVIIELLFFLKKKRKRKRKRNNSINCYC